MKYLIPLLLLFAIPAYATEDKAPNGIPWNDYHTADHFQWEDYDDALHIAVGYGVAFTTATILHKYAKKSALESAILGVAAGALMGAMKEGFLDTYTSKTDIRTWTGGALLGGTSFFVINF